MSSFLYGILAVVASCPVFLGMNFHEIYIFFENIFSAKLILVLL